MDALAEREERPEGEGGADVSTDAVGLTDSDAVSVTDADVDGHGEVELDWDGDAVREGELEADELGHAELETEADVEDVRSGERDTNELRENTPEALPLRVVERVRVPLGVAEGDKDADRVRVAHAVADEHPQNVVETVSETEPDTETVPETVGEPELEPDSETDVDSDADDDADCDALWLRATLREPEEQGLAESVVTKDKVTVAEVHVDGLGVEEEQTERLPVSDPLVHCEPLEETVSEEVEHSVTLVDGVTLRVPLPDTDAELVTVTVAHWVEDAVTDPDALADALDDVLPEAPTDTDPLVLCDTVPETVSDAVEHGVALNDGVELRVALSDRDTV